MHVFQRSAYRLFGRIAVRRARETPRLASSLERAYIPIRPDAYLASGYLSMAAVTTLSLSFILAVFLLGVTGVAQIPMRLVVMLLPVPILLAVALYLTLLLLPDVKGLQRARDIDAKLPYALNYIATMSSAGATPVKVFAALAGNRLYGEVGREAERIDRDLTLLGHDIVTALGRAIDRTPSVKFQDFLQGAITALTSGGDLKAYFLNKSEQYLHENRQDQEKFLESLGVLAESFVVVVVAGPLFLIVLLSVMTSFGSAADQVLFLGYMFVLLLLPLSQAAFAFTIHTMTPEA